MPINTAVKPNRLDYRHLIDHLKNSFLNQLQRLFYHIGVCIGTRPLIPIIITLIIALALSIGIVRLRFAERLKDGFTPNDAQSRYEDDVNAQFQKNNIDGINSHTERFVALVRAADNGSLLRPDYLDRVIQVSSFLNSNISISFDGKQYRYLDICRPYCDINAAVITLWTEQRKKLQSIDGDQSTTKIMIDYPVSTASNGYRYNLAMHLFGVNRTNARDTNDYQRIDHVSMIMLFFYSDTSDLNRTIIAAQWEAAVLDWVKSGASEFTDMTINVIGDKILSSEMIRGGMSLVPYLIVGFVLSISFVLFTIVTSAVYHQRMDAGKVLIAGGTMLSPVLAVTTTFGILGLFDCEMYPMHMVIPFLILAIGVDDAFLMVHAWNRISPEYDHYDRYQRVAYIPEILGKVLEEIGPSITITSLTNAIAFGIGTTISTPVICQFCLAATIAMTLDFVFELSFFGGLLAIAGRFDVKDVPPLVEKYAANHRSNFRDNCRKAGRRWLKVYCKWLTKTTIRLFVFAFAIAFFIVGLLGTLRARTFINSQKIIPGDSPLLRTDALLERYTWREYEPLHVFVDRPPNIANATEYRLLLEMVAEFENLPNSLGHDATLFWLNDYIRLYNRVMTDDRTDNQIPTVVSYTYVPLFLEYFSMWNKSVRWHYDDSGDVIVSQFYFIAGYHNLSTWMDRATAMLAYRRLAEKWHRYNVTVYQSNSGVYDAIFALKTTTIQTAGLTLICMLGVCLLFIPNCAGVLTAGWAICSISLGVFGCLSWWSLDLDPVTMSAIVMSIGFSVDYTAHVSYHYQRARQQLQPGHSRSDRLLHTLDSVGWPMLQAGTSTLLCFVPVIVHPDYTPSVFIRTIFLVVTFGLLHGLLLLPTILAALPDCCGVLYSPSPMMMLVTGRQKSFNIHHKSHHQRQTSTSNQIFADPKLLCVDGGGGRSSTTTDDNQPTNDDVDDAQTQIMRL